MLETSARARQGTFVRDLIAGERNAIRPFRERRLGRIGREHDDDDVAGPQKRAEWPVEERLALQRLDQLGATKASRRSAREKDPRGSVHARVISTTAL